MSDNYFTTLGLKMLEGRDFTIDDNDEKQPVAIVNASFARKYFGQRKCNWASGADISTRLNRVPGEQLSASCPTR